MFSTISIILLLIVVFLLLYLATLKGSYSIRRSQLINSDIETVFNKMIDLKSWPEWSPWVIHEPEFS